MPPLGAAASVEHGTHATQTTRALDRPGTRRRKLLLVVLGAVGLVVVCALGLDPPGTHNRFDRRRLREQPRDVRRPPRQRTDRLGRRAITFAPKRPGRDRRRRRGLRRLPGRRHTCRQGLPAEDRSCASRAWPQCPLGSAVSKPVGARGGCDVPVRWSCRTGVCHKCDTALVAGAVNYQFDPIDPPVADNVLICCSQPKADIAINL